MFEDIKKMLPARVKATAGLLIEPHFLERSKITHKKPQGENNQYTSSIHIGDSTILTSENNQLDALVNANLSENVFGENEQYYAEIYTASVQTTTAENYQYDTLITSTLHDNLTGENEYNEAEINAQLGYGIQSEIEGLNSNQIVGQTQFEEAGFGLFGKNGVALRTYLDIDGSLIKDRIKVNIVTKSKTREFVKFAVTASNGQGDPRGGYNIGTQTYYTKDLNIQSISGSIPVVGSGDIVNVTPLDGYLSTHYRNVSDLTAGLQNSYYKGCKNTAATTLDGASPIEVFATNPNTLKVNPSGRPANEPILEVE
jgi:hypothetical protein